jgi:hypothetical protein
VPARPSGKGKLEKIKALGSQEDKTTVRDLLEKESQKEVCILAEF